jgi:hypothetical protein
MATQRLMRRRAFLVAAAAVLVGASLPAQQPGVRPSDTRSRNGRQITLRDQLRTGLKAFTPADFVFIDLVVLRVNQGVLPRELVDSTFLWARRRVQTTHPNYRQRPIVYFQPALAIRARKLGISL